MSAERRVAAILAGGEGRRFGGRKALVAFAGRAMCARVANALDTPRLAVIGDAEAAAHLGAVALDDPQDVARGALRGVLAGLRWARGEGADWLAVAPCDSPLLPPGLARRLIGEAQAQGASAAMARAGGKAFPLCSAWRVDLLDAFAEAVRPEKHPRARVLLHDLGGIEVDFEDPACFANINTPEALAEAEAMFAKR